MTWLLKNARLNDNDPLTDIAIRDEQILRVGPQLTPGDETQIWDLDGRVVLPGFVDIHTHLDKTYGPIENESGTLLEAIAMWRNIRQQRTAAGIVANAERALRNAIVNGVTAMRTHIDVSADDALLPVETLLPFRETYRERIDLQFVALGYSSSPAAAAAMERALALGVDFVGGAPALTVDPTAEIDAALALAEKWDRPVDLHIDETEDPDMVTLEYLAEETIRRGWQGRVTAGHCCSLAFTDPERAKRVIDKVAAAEITIVTLPSCNLVLIGREQEPSPRGITPVKKLLAKGISVCAASDNVHDPFNPFGSYDLLQICNLNAHVAQMTGKAELYQSLAMTISEPAHAFYGQPRLIANGQPADLVIIDSKSILEAIVSPPARLGTFKAGRLIVKTDFERRWYG